MTHPILLAVSALLAGTQVPLPAATEAARARRVLATCGAESRALRYQPGRAWEQRLSAFISHHQLRRALNEPLPSSPTMVMLFGSGGHGIVEERSTVLVRGDDGGWSGTQASRSTGPNPDEAPRPAGRLAWRLSREDGRRLDALLADPCLFAEPSAPESGRSGPPSLSSLGFRLDVATPDRRRSFAFDGGSVGGRTAELFRLAWPPPQN